MKQRKMVLRAASALILVLTCTAARATEPGTVFYTPADFAAASPATALEMVQRVPGFALQNGGDSRGLAASRGNVLFDGAHLASKSDTIWDTLNRMPASRVERLELIREAHSGIDMAGWPQVLNVVLKAEAEHVIQARIVNMNWLKGGPTLQGKLVGSGGKGPTAFEWNLGFYPEKFGPGGGMVTTDPTHVATGRRTDDVESAFERSELSGAVTRKITGGSVRLNGALYHNNYQEHTHYGQFLVSSGVETPDGTDISNVSDRTTGGEIGLDAEKAFGPTTLKLSLLERRWRTVYDERFDDNDADGRVGGSDDHARDLWNETIVRLSSARSFGPHTLEAGIEAVHNTLAARELYYEDTGSGLIAVDLPAGNVDVAEKRAELFISDVWTLRPGLMLESGLRYERSDIATTGDVDQANSFAFLKPRMRLNWSPNPKDQWRIEAAREVSQLDFKDFAASSNAGEGGVTAGNPDIAPTDSWVVSVGYEHRFAGKGSVSGSVFHHWITDALDYIPVDGGGDSRGNIDSASMNGAKFAVTVPLGVYIKGAEVTVDGTWQRYRLRDPFTNALRGLSDTPESQMHVLYRQDIPRYRLSWQAEANWSSERYEYRSTYVRRLRNEPWVDAFFEKKLADGTALKAGVSNIFGQESRRRREFYTAERGTGVLDQLDERRREDGRLVYFRVLKRI